MPLNCNELVEPADSHPVAYPFSRIIGFTNPGLPLVAHWREPFCKVDDDTLHPYAGREIGYTSSGLAVVSTGYACCDFIDPRPRVIPPGCPWTQPVTRRLALYTYGDLNCPSANPTKNPLEYDDGTGCWLGSFSLAGGSIAVKVCCDPVTGGFRVTLTGSCIPGGSITAVCGTDCWEPLDIALNATQMGDCCLCEQAASGTSGGNAVGFNLRIVGNCPVFAFGRIIGYTSPPPGQAPMPVVTGQYDCPWNSRAHGCCYPICDFTLTATTISGDCGYLDGTYPFPWNPAQLKWSINIGPPGAPVGPHSVQANVQMTCADSHVSPDCACAFLTIKLGCTVDATDPDNPDPPPVSVTVCLGHDLETLDVTVDVPLHAFFCCAGTVRLRIMR